jgi:hypothetical protein
VVAALADIGPLTYAKVLIAKVEGQRAYMSRRKDEQTGVTTGCAIRPWASFPEVPV